MRLLALVHADGAAWTQMHLHLGAQVLLRSGVLDVFVRAWVRLCKGGLANLHAFVLPHLHAAVWMQMHLKPGAQVLLHPGVLMLLCLHRHVYIKRGCIRSVRFRKGSVFRYYRFRRGV